MQKASLADSFVEAETKNCRNPKSRHEMKLETAGDLSLCPCHSADTEYQHQSFD